MTDRTHRWPRATTADPRYGRVCDCGNLKTDQALTCADCAAARRRAPDYWTRRSCPTCGGPKAPRAATCRRCCDDAMRGRTRPGQPQPDSHPWRARRRLS